MLPPGAAFCVRAPSLAWGERRCQHWRRRRRTANARWTAACCKRMAATNVDGELPTEDHVAGLPAGRLVGRPHHRQQAMAGGGENELLPAAAHERCRLTAGDWRWRSTARRVGSQAEG